MPLLSILDMHRLIEQNVQKMGFFAYQDLETEEIDLQINNQIHLIIQGILDKFFGRKPKVSEIQGFQASQVSLDNLRKLHKVSNPVTLNSEEDQISFTLPEDYYHHIKTIATISYDCYESGVKETKTELVAVRISHTQSDLRNRPFYKTGKDSPLAEIVGTGLFMFKDSTFDITAARITYIKYPAKVLYAKDGGGNYDSGNSVHCDLDDSLHHMLVDMTSIRIMKILESNPQKIVNLEQETL